MYVIYVGLLWLAAVRFGRVPKREKAKIQEQMRQSMMEADLNKVTRLSFKICLCFCNLVHLLISSI